MSSFVDDTVGILVGVARDSYSGNTALQSFGPSGCISIEDPYDYPFAVFDPNTGRCFIRSGDMISGNFTVESVCAELVMSDGFSKNYTLTQPSERSLDPFYQNYSIVGNFNEISNKVAISASPGFTWGKSGAIPSNTWLLNEGVPSNKSGRTIFLHNAEIVEFFVSNELPNTFDVELWEHNGVIYNLLTTISLTAQRTKTEGVTGVSPTYGYELATKVVNGSAKNITCGILMVGERVSG